LGGCDAASESECHDISLLLQYRIISKLPTFNSHHSLCYLSRNSFPRQSCTSVLVFLILNNGSGFVLVVGAFLGNWNIRHNCRSETQVDVLAMLRNQESAEKVFQAFGAKVLITLVEADVISKHGIQQIIEQVLSISFPLRSELLLTIYHIRGKGPKTLI
jgi:hypothetical protein